MLQPQTCPALPAASLASCLTCYLAALLGLLPFLACYPAWPILPCLARHPVWPFVCHDINRCYGLLLIYCLSYTASCFLIIIATLLIVSTACQVLIVNCVCHFSCIAHYFGLHTLLFVCGSSPNLFIAYHALLISSCLSCVSQLLYMISIWACHDHTLLVVYSLSCVSYYLLFMLAHYLCVARWLIMHCSLLLMVHCLLLGWCIVLLISWLFIMLGSLVVVAHHALFVRLSYIAH